MGDWFGIFTMTASIFKILATIFRESEIKCILIGGYAVNSYKVTRHTADVDFMITKESFEKIKEKLFQYGYTIVCQQDVFVQLKNSQGLRDLDFIFSEPDTIDKFIESGNTTVIASESFYVPSLQYLIALKLHSIKYNFQRGPLYFNDIPDIVNLVKANKVDFNTPEFLKLCEKFGTKEITTKSVTYHKKRSMVSIQNGSQAIHNV